MRRTTRRRCSSRRRALRRNSAAALLDNEPAAGAAVPQFRPGTAFRTRVDSALFSTATVSVNLVRESRRPPLTGSAFIRALAALNDVHAPASPDAFAQRLSQWLAWTDAFSL